MKMKRILAVFLCVMMILPALASVGVSAAGEQVYIIFNMHISGERHWDKKFKADAGTRLKLNKAEQYGCKVPDGYILTGWSNTKERANKGIVDFSIGKCIKLPDKNETIQLYATWEVAPPPKTAPTLYLDLKNPNGTIKTYYNVTEVTAPLMSIGEKILLGWSDTRDGAVVYHCGDTITLTDDMTLYAVWADPPVTVCDLILLPQYTGGNTKTFHNLAPGTVKTLPAFEREDSDFLGWSTVRGGPVCYVAGDTVTVTGDVYLYAVWSKAGSTTLTLRYNYPEGGSIAFEGLTKKTLPGASRDGFEFLGWSIFQDAAPVYREGDTIAVNYDRTLWAQWQELPAPPEDAPTYSLNGDCVLFFDEYGEPVTRAAEGQTVIVSADYDVFPDNVYFTDDYVSDQVAVTVDEVGDGYFTMPAEAVTVNPALTAQEEYTVTLTGQNSVQLPEGMTAALNCASAYGYDEDLEEGVLDFGRDGAPDVLLSYDDTVTRLPGADSLTGSVRIIVDVPTPYRYNTVTFIFAAGQSAGPVITKEPSDCCAGDDDYPEVGLTAEGNGLTYQWYYRSFFEETWSVSAETDDCFDSFPMSDMPDGRDVYCIVTDSAGNTAESRIAGIYPVYEEEPEDPTEVKSYMDGTTLVLKGYLPRNENGIVLPDGVTKADVVKIRVDEDEGAAFIADASCMFEGFLNLTEADLFGADMSRITNADSMFKGCSALTTVYVNVPANGEAVEPESGADMFYGCTSLVGGEGTAYAPGCAGKEYAKVDGRNDSPGYFTAKYPVLVYEEDPNGTVTPDKRVALRYEIVNIDVTPNAGYRIKSVSVNGSTLEPASGAYSFTMPASYVVISAEFESDDSLPGDVNGDGVVSAKDIRDLKMYFAGLLQDDDIVFGNADLNGDGDITSKDVRELKQLLVS